MVKKTHACSRVLVADDSEVCRGVLIILLENAGHEVVGVNDGHEAVRMLRDQAFDLAILDNEMPRVNGLQALAEVRGFLPDLPVLVCSGTVTPDQAVKYRALGIEDLLRKPVNPVMLRDRVADVLVRRAARGGNTVRPFPVDVAPAKGEPAGWTPLVSGLSSQALHLRADMERLTKFRSVAILEGAEGSGRFELALSLGAGTDTHRLVCHADDLDQERLPHLLKEPLGHTRPVLLIVLEAERLTMEAQALLEDLVRGRMKAFANLPGRLRLVLCSRQALGESAFNEFLLLRASTATCAVPAFDGRQADWCEIARAIAGHVSQGGADFSVDALEWIRGRRWPGDYMQLHRTLELARVRAAESPEIRTGHLVWAVSREPTWGEPLYHDLLFTDHSCPEV